MRHRRRFPTLVILQQATRVRNVVQANASRIRRRTAPVGMPEPLPHARRGGSVIA